MKQYFLLFLWALHCNADKILYANSFLAVYNGVVGEQNFDVFRKLGYVLDKKIDIGPGFYRFIRNDTETKSKSAPRIVIDEKKLQMRDPQLLSFEQERLWFREKKSRVNNRAKRAVNVSDAQWSDQWHLSSNHFPSMGVYDVWNLGFTGQGITVAIVDDGIDVTHTDLVGNYNASLSFDVIYGHTDPSHKYYYEGHGTNCAGIVAAVKNTECVIGTAYHASIPAIRLLDSVQGATDSEEAMAFVHELNNIDIYSNSWGPADYGFGFYSSLGSVQEAALLQGVTKGRGGKGAIYTWAAGNGGYSYDDCNTDGYANSMYTIAVTSLAPDSSAAWYSEECTSVMVATYGGDDRQDLIATTERNNSCIDTFQGTSAACPVAAGILALVLQANPDLTWRDIQHLIVECSTNTGLSGANFYINGADKKVSLTHGFGLMNAQAMVSAASSWQTVPVPLSCVQSSSTVNESVVGIGTISAKFSVDSCLIQYLEHVKVKVHFEAYFREYTSIYLVSPSGTDSRILRERYFDSETSSVAWTFMSLHTWGENPMGIWTLRMESSSKNIMSLYSWQLMLYGTVTDPLSGTPSAGTLGGDCNSNTDCKEDGTACYKTARICVICNNGYIVSDNYCIQGARLGEYCNSSIPCFENSVECIDNACKTVLEGSTKRAVILSAVVAGTVGVAVLATIGYVVYMKCFVAKATASVAPLS